MLYALRDGARVLATPKTDGSCPLCTDALIAKCGEIVTWHWSHRAGVTEDCDAWGENESAWHLGWKARVAPEHTEVVMGPHRADIKLGDRVIELQHSALTPAEIREREAFYGPRMLWVWDAVEPYAAGRLYANKIYRPGRVSLRWIAPRRSLLACTRPVWLDLGPSGMIWLKKLYPDPPFRGWGVLMATEAFVEHYMRLPSRSPRLAAFEAQLPTTGPVPLLTIGDPGPPGAGL